MKFKNPLLVVSDMERSIGFYRGVLGLRIVSDFGANKTLTGGVCLQTAESWPGLIGKAGENLVYGGRTAELYFEEPDFDAWVKRLEQMEEIRYVHPVVEHRWGQRAVRIYDPDKNIIEVGESLNSVARRFAQQGMTPAQIAARMDVPEAFVRKLLK